MATNSISENENILVRVDQQNIVHIDPNSILTSDGEIKSRLVDHENLVTYVNLEADLVPRSILFADKAENSLLSVASGTFNMMRNQGDKSPFENNFDSNWTETFNPALTKKDKDGNEIKDKTILVWREQGVGDEIMYLGCLLDLIDTGMNIIVETDERLVPLLSKSFPSCLIRAQMYDIYSHDKKPYIEDYDFQIPVGSLPRLFRKTINRPVRFYPLEY